MRFFKQPLFVAYGAAFVFAFGVFLWNRNADPRSFSGQSPASGLESGHRLVTTLCLSCHRAQPNHEVQERGLAPPLWGVRDHYLKVYPEKDDFVRAVADFLQAPTEEHSLMPGAVKRFKIMPAQLLPRIQLESVARAVYAAEGFTEPVWWEAHRREHQRERAKAHDDTAP